MADVVHFPMAANSCLALGQLAHFTQMPTAGTNLKSFMHDAQSHIESLLALPWQFFVDPALSLAGKSSLPGAWGVAAGMAAAGLTESGYWRRLPPGGSKPADWSDYADDAEFEADEIVFESSYAGAFEPSGTVSLSTAANASPVSGRVSVFKNRSSGLFLFDGEVSNKFVRFPRYNVPGASETYTIVFIPRGDNIFHEITGAINEGVTNTSTSFELETEYILKWFWNYPSVINGASIPWATISSKLPWPAVDNSSNSADISFHHTDMCLVTDYDFNDGSLS